MNDNQNNSNNMENKPKTIIHILMGMGISVIAYALTIGIASVVNTMAVTAIMAFIILGVFGFLIVRFFRTGYTAAAITMLIFISPLLVFLLLFGACAIVGLPF
ncbi:MAG TPA: hypothetical protein VEF53_01285 [Patescibacteria group bacterium]|nr:hypothetical protein [Patescibacteria group bacterium]